MIEESEHGANFAGGAAGNVEEGEKLGGGAAFEALGDVVGDADGCEAELILEAGGGREGAVVGEREGAKGEVGGGLSGRGVSKRSKVMR